MYDGIIFNKSLDLDLLVDNKIIVEIKTVEQINAVSQAQIIRHLKLTDKKLSFLINFNVPLFRNGIKRFVNTK